MALVSEGIKQGIRVKSESNLPKKNDDMISVLVVLITKSITIIKTIRERI